MKEIITKILGPLVTELKTKYDDNIVHTIRNKVLEYEVEEYNRNLQIKTLLHRTTPKRLLDIYQPLAITKNYSQRTVVLKVEDFFQSQFVTLIGGAGSGKSTIVKYLVLKCIDDKIGLPIKIELRYLNDYEGTLKEYIYEKVFKINKLGHNDKIIDQILSSGQCIIFFDGYDELESASLQVRTKEIDDFVKVYNENKYALTTRPFTTVELLPLFHNFRVCDLSDEEIDLFIDRQFTSDEKELSGKIQEAIALEANANYKTFVRNPLLLSMFILTFQSYADIPQKRSIFYKQVYDTLFSLHDSMSKLAFIREKRSGFSKEVFEDFLKIFSFLSYFEEKYIFSETYLLDKFDLIKSKRSKFQGLNSDIVYDLTVSISIITIEGNHYTFPHRSLQEYFTAAYLLDLSNAGRNKIYLKVLGEFKTAFNQMGHKNMTLEKHDNAFKMMERFNSLSQLLDEMDEIGFAKKVWMPIYKKIIDTIDKAIEDNTGYLSSSILYQLWGANVLGKVESGVQVRSLIDDYSNVSIELHQKLHAEEKNSDTVKNISTRAKRINKNYKSQIGELIKHIDEKFTPILIQLRHDFEIVLLDTESKVNHFKESEDDFSKLV